MSAPFNCRYDGGIFRPIGRFDRECKETFKDGEIVRLEAIEGRSMASHNHAFAWLHEAWLNLPEELQDQYPTSEHLRKRALLQAGYYREQLIDAGSNAAALRVAAGVRAREEFSLVIVRGLLVVIRDPESQSLRAMGGKRFQESKSAIMAIVAEMIGVTPEELGRNSGRSA